jgi:hypothetical protein
VKLSFYGVFILLFFAGCTNQSRKIASDEKIYDIVFDIDWTIVYQVRERYISAPEVMKIGDEYYHTSYNLIPLIEDLLNKPNVRVSFFSGGSSRRNLELLEKIKLSNGKSLREIAYKILSINDLEIRPGVDPNDSTIKFSKRYQKNLLRINSNLENVVMIDDIENFLPEKQSDHMFFLQKTYEYFPTFADAKEARILDEIKSDYIPLTYQEYIGEKQKLNWVKSVLDQSFVIAEGQNKNLSNVVQTFIFDNDHKRIPRPKYFEEHSLCLKSLEAFLPH